MLVRHIMTSPVYTISPDTPVLEAAALMKEKKIERLPVVKDGTLVGIVTKDRVLRAAPSSATSLSVHELNYLYSKLSVGEIMQKKVTTVSPDATVEAAVRLAQENRVGSLPVVENGKVVGILTTNDFFYLVLNPVLGIGQGGSRISVRRCQNAQEIADAMACIIEMGFTVTNAAYLPSRRGDEKDLLIHLAEDNPKPLVECMNKRGLSADSRER